MLHLKSDMLKCWQNENLSGVYLQLLLYKPVPLQKGEDYDYLLALKQDFRTTIRRSPFYLTLVEKKQDIERYSDKYQLGQQDVQGNWTPSKCVYAVFSVVDC